MKNKQYALKPNKHKKTKESLGPGCMIITRNNKRPNCPISLTYTRLRTRREVVLTTVTVRVFPLALARLCKFCVKKCSRSTYTGQ